MESDSEKRGNMDKELEQRMLVYMEELEKTNQEILIALKWCLKLLAHIKPAAPNPNEWEGMLNEVKRIIKVTENIHSGKPFH